MAVGGGRPRDLDKGWYVEPTVFADVDNDMKIAREEIFGPVLSVIPYDDEDEAVAHRQRLRLRPVRLGVDGRRRPRRRGRGPTAHRHGADQLVDDPRLQGPFGGFKKSGIGRELGPEGIGPYTEYQSIIYPS